MRSIGASCAALAGVAAITVATAVMGQEWPAARPILVVSPSGAGTTNDFVARTVLDQVAQDIGQHFVLENRLGGDGSVGVVSVVKAAPDGYTLLLTSSAMSTAVILHKSLPYDALRDLEPVAMFGAQPSVLVAALATGVRTVADLVAAAKAKPGALKFASVGIGSASYIAGERFRVAAGLDVQHIPYPGPKEAIDDLVAGRVDFYFIPIAPAAPLYAQGKIVALAVSTPKRSVKLPVVPTLAEAGYTVAPYMYWGGLSAPAKTPRDIVNKLNLEIAKVLDNPAIRDKFQRIGAEPTPMSPEQYGAFFANDVAAMIKLSKEASITPKD